MSNLLPSRPRHVGQRRTVAIVSSLYNGEYVRGLADHARRELKEISNTLQTVEYEVPGAFEIPLAVQRLAARNDVDAIIALGVIIEGETAHASLIATSITMQPKNRIIPPTLSRFATRTITPRAAA